MLCLLTSDSLFWVLRRVWLCIHRTPPIHYRNFQEQLTLFSKALPERMNHTAVLLRTDCTRIVSDRCQFFDTQAPQPNPPITAKETCAPIPRVDNVSANHNDVKTPAVRRRWCKAGLVCKRL